MDLSSFILALLIQWNAFADAGYQYDVSTNTWIAPAVTQPARETRSRLRIGREL